MSSESPGRLTADILKSREQQEIDAYPDNLALRVHRAIIGDTNYDRSEVGMSRLEDLQRFYETLDKLEQKIGGARILADCGGRMNWPKQGVYFFREPGEERSDTGDGQRIARVGISTATEKSKATLWTRLRQHKGTDSTGGGDHRTSVFRKIVGEALIKRDGIESPTWGIGSTAPRSTKEEELSVELAVSGVIRHMPFLWVAVEGETGRNKRGYIERNAIALLSNHGRPALDPPSDGWLGGCCNAELVRNSGLWNQDYVKNPHELAFLDDLESAVDRMGR